MGRTKTIIAKPSRNVPSAMNATRMMTNSVIGPSSSPVSDTARFSGICVSARNGENTAAPMMMK